MGFDFREGFRLGMLRVNLGSLSGKGFVGVVCIFQFQGFVWGRGTEGGPQEF